MACGIVPITGTVVEVAPDVCGDDVMYPRVVIRKEDGTTQEFAPVHAIYEVAGLIEANASGHFIFWQRPTECRLAFFYSNRGARAVDFDAVREYLEQVELSSQSYSSVVSAIVVEGKLLPLSKGLHVETRSQAVKLRHEIVPVVAQLHHCDDRTKMLP